MRDGIKAYTVNVQYLGGKAACSCKMIDNLFFLQAVAVDGVSTVCPVEINCCIPHQTRLYESRGKDEGCYWQSNKVCY